MNHDEFGEIVNFVLLFLGCEQVLTVANGSISSPAYGLQPYPSNQECTYLIKRPKGGPLSLRFTHFDLDDGDFVQVSLSVLKEQCFVPILCSSLMLLTAIRSIR